MPRHESVLVDALPECNICLDGTPAEYDAKTTMGPWAYLCQPHFDQIGMGLGLGIGQRLVVRDAE